MKQEHTFVTNSSIQCASPKNAAIHSEPHCVHMMLYNNMYRDSVAGTSLPVHVTLREGASAAITLQLTFCTLCWPDVQLYSYLALFAAGCKGLSSRTYTSLQELCVHLEIHTSCLHIREPQGSEHQALCGPFETEIAPSASLPAASIPVPLASRSLESF